MEDWSQILIGLGTLGGAIGSAIGAQLANARTRRVVDRVWNQRQRELVRRFAVRERELIRRIQALEKAQGWSPRKDVKHVTSD